MADPLFLWDPFAASSHGKPCPSGLAPPEAVWHPIETSRRASTPDSRPKLTSTASGEMGGDTSGPADPDWTSYLSFSNIFNHNGPLYRPLNGDDGDADDGGNNDENAVDLARGVANGKGHDIGNAGDGDHRHGRREKAGPNSVGASSVVAPAAAPSSFPSVAPSTTSAACHPTPPPSMSHYTCHHGHSVPAPTFPAQLGAYGHLPPHRAERQARPRREPTPAIPGSGSGSMQRAPPPEQAPPPPPGHGDQEPPAAGMPRALFDPAYPPLAIEHPLQLFPDRPALYTPCPPSPPIAQSSRGESRPSTSANTVSSSSSNCSSPPGAAGPAGAGMLLPFYPDPTATTAQQVQPSDPVANHTHPGNSGDGACSVARQHNHRKTLPSCDGCKRRRVRCIRPVPTADCKRCKDKRLDCKILRPLGRQKHQRTGKRIEEAKRKCGTIETGAGAGAGPSIGCRPVELKHEPGAPGPATIEWWCPAPPEGDGFGSWAASKSSLPPTTRSPRQTETASSNGSGWASKHKSHQRTRSAVYPNGMPRRPLHPPGRRHRRSRSVDDGRPRIYPASPPSAAEAALSPALSDPAILHHLVDCYASASDPALPRAYYPLLHAAVDDPASRPETAGLLAATVALGARLSHHPAIVRPASGCGARGGETPAADAGSLFGAGGREEHPQHGDPEDAGRRREAVCKGLEERALRVCDESGMLRNPSCENLLALMMLEFMVGRDDVTGMRSRPLRTAVQSHARHLQACDPQYSLLVCDSLTRPCAPEWYNSLAGLGGGWLPILRDCVVSGADPRRALHTTEEDAALIRERKGKAPLVGPNGERNAEAELELWRCSELNTLLDAEQIIWGLYDAVTSWFRLFVEQCQIRRSATRPPRPLDVRFVQAMWDAAERFSEVAAASSVALAAHCPSLCARDGADPSQPSPLSFFSSSFSASEDISALGDNSAWLPHARFLRSNLEQAEGAWVNLQFCCDKALASHILIAEEDAASPSPILPQRYLAGLREQKRESELRCFYAARRYVRSTRAIMGCSPSKRWAPDGLAYANVKWTAEFAWYIANMYTEGEGGPNGFTADAKVADLRDLLNFYRSFVWSWGDECGVLDRLNMLLVDLRRAASVPDPTPAQAASGTGSARADPDLISRGGLSPPRAPDEIHVVGSGARVPTPHLDIWGALVDPARAGSPTDEPRLADAAIWNDLATSFATAAAAAAAATDLTYSPEVATAAGPFPPSLSGLESLLNGSYPPGADTVASRSAAGAAGPEPSGLVSEGGLGVAPSGHAMGGFAGFDAGAGGAGDAFEVDMYLSKRWGCEN